MQCSAFSGTTKTTCTTRAFRKIVDDIKSDLNDGHDDELSYSFHRIQRKDGCPAIPQRNQYLSLIVRVDQANQVTEHDAVLVAHAGTGQYHCRQARIIQVDRDARRNQLGLAGLQKDWRINAGPQVEPSGAGRCIRGELIAQARVQNLDVDVAHRTFFLMAIKTGMADLRG